MGNFQERFFHIGSRDPDIYIYIHIYIERERNGLNFVAKETVIHTQKI